MLGIVKKVMYFRMICSLRSQVVLFLLFFMGKVEKGITAVGFAVPEGAR